MLGPGLQFGRSREDDRFYNPAKTRRSHHNQIGQDNLLRAKTDVTAHSQFQNYSIKDKFLVSPGVREKKISDEPENQTSAEAPSLCNLERFMESITPTVPAQYHSKTTTRDWRCSNVDPQTYFVLGDLWESFGEWSAYGVGVPLAMKDIDGVVQYYVPYLSAIQIYCDPSKSTRKSRQTIQECDSDYFRDSSSDGSSDSEHERCSNFVRDQGNCHINGAGMDRLTLREQQQSTHQDGGFSSDEGESWNNQEYLLFEHLERIQPYHREPLADKILDLARGCPELKTLRSCDILPSSWISVAWYPIYRIPTGPTLKELDACFLTFHSLHTPSLAVAGGAQQSAFSLGGDVPKISLPAFGLASYKFKASWWAPYKEGKLSSSLFQAASNWLSLHKVNHPDFLFFCRK
ncbi:uncharacterized protein LOC124913810 [Impatiens glandulifera]|uniref:uncharacterized protein LOC124913810 n=1 Tax=Impatiens glandulifera TaxID=253017 RepID=UPI001FB12A24|nr:uncharacterized protein LOC124913810 [Impatiens glandulifera]